MYRHKNWHALADINVRTQSSVFKMLKKWHALPEERRHRSKGTPAAKCTISKMHYFKDALFDYISSAEGGDTDTLGRRFSGAERAWLGRQGSVGGTFF